MVEHHQVLFALSRTHAAADLLHRQGQALRRPQQDDGADRWNVEALRDEITARQDLNLAGREPLDQPIALKHRQAAVHACRTISSATEGACDRLGMLDRAAVGNRRLMIRLQPIFGDRIAGHGVRTDRQLIGFEVAAEPVHAASVDQPRRNEHPGLGEIAQELQLGDRRPDHQGIEDPSDTAAEPFPVQPLRRRSCAEDLSLRPRGSTCAQLVDTL